MNVDESVTLRLITNGTNLIRCALRCFGTCPSNLRIDIRSCKNDTFASMPEVIAVVGFTDKSLTKLREMIVEAASIADANPFTEFREGEWLLGRR